MQSTQAAETEFNDLQDQLVNKIEARKFKGYRARASLVENDQALLTQRRKVNVPLKDAEKRYIAQVSKAEFFKMQSEHGPLSRGINELILGPEGLESIVDMHMPTEFVSCKPESTTIADEMHETRRSLHFSRRDTGMPIG